jgi:hypothetical protein
MTQEEQRTAIAEACGIVGPFDNRWIKEYEKEGGDSYGFTGFEKGELVFIPDYLNDLNAMHDAEKVLVSLRWVSYSRRLQTLCDESVTWPIHATASQRAEAFLRTIGKWKEAK